jgi:superfamily II RNA helicase
MKVESWVNGASWRELCRDTSLDQGDVCRMLRRTVEVLRQVSRDRESEVQRSREKKKLMSERIE